MKTLSAMAMAVAVAMWGCGVTEGGDELASQTQDLHVAPVTTRTVTSTKLGARFTRTDIVSDQSEGALAVDPTLVNAWGLTFSPSGLAFVAVNGNGVVNVYDARGRPSAQGMTVPTPPGGMGPSAPTGQVFNADLAAFRGDTFIVSTEDGTLAGWQGSLGRSFQIRVDSSNRSAVYKSVALASWQGQHRLYATDFHNARIDVFDESYVAVKTGSAFATDVPKGFAPFNIVAVNGALAVSYAMQDADAKDDVKGAGLGFVDLFDGDGRRLQRLTAQGVLNAPWGMTVAPLTWGPLANRLLIGNFGDGTINAFRLDSSRGGLTAVSEGPLVDGDGTPLKIDGLWAIAIGPGSGGFDDGTLYFTAGPMQEKHGVFGMLQFRTTPTRHFAQ
jgi:uncharacterized protein (TIGR03118 family)